VGTIDECDRQTDRFAMTKTALCIASRGKNAALSNRYAYNANVRKFEITEKSESLPTRITDLCQNYLMS